MVSAAQIARLGPTIGIRDRLIDLNDPDVGERRKPLEELTSECGTDLESLSYRTIGDHQKNQQLGTCGRARCPLDHNGPDGQGQHHGNDSNRLTAWRIEE